MLLYEAWYSEVWSSDAACQIKEAVSGRIHNVFVTREIESVNHKHEQCCYVPCTALPIWTLGLRTEGLVSR